MIKKNYIKYILGIVSMVIIGALHIIFFSNNEKYDVYLFYDHKRYLTNILYDISVLYDFTILTYFLMGMSRKIWRPLFIFSLIQWVAYFLVYRQSWVLISIPLLVILYYYEFKLVGKWIKQSQ